LQIDVANQINFTSQGRLINAELYTPAGPGTAGVVVIAYGSDGLTNQLSGPWATMIRGYAESLTNSGFVTMIPDYLSLTSTSPGVAVLTSIKEHRDKWQAVLLDAIDHAKTLPSVAPARIGLLGFSLGGHLCSRLRKKVRVLVEYFAPVLDGIGQSGSLSHAQIHHGKDDKVVDFSNAEQIKKILEQEGTVADLYPYSGANHGFTGSDQPNSDARTLSKSRTLAFFQAHL